MHATRTILLSVGLAAVLTTSLSTAPVAAATSRSRVPAATTVARTPATTTRPAPTPKHPVPHKVRRPGRAKAVMPTRPRAALRPGLTSEPMTYHGGVLMTAPAHVYLVWYGDWSGRPAVPVLTDLVRGFGGSAYAATNTTYTDGGGRHVTADVTLAGSVDDTYSHGRTLTDAAVKSVVRRAVTRGGLPVDPDGVHVVLTSSDVRESSGFGTRYCGWHSHGTVAGANLKYVFAGDPSTQAPRDCAAPVAPTPTGDLAADALASTVVHELDETLTDPYLDGWYDRWFNENGDKCAWTYGPLRRTPSGAWTNVRLGGRDLLVQRNWVVSPTQGCAMAA